MIAKLKLSLRRNEGALQRVLGVAARRGHPVVSMVVEPTQSGTSWDVSLDVEAGERDPDRLVRQLQKLEDVDAASKRLD